MSHARLQGSEGMCSGMVQHACHMFDFKEVKMSVVGDYLNFNMHT